MTGVWGVSVAVLLAVLALAAYVDRIYFEMGKFLSREYTENIEAWEERVEPRLRLSRESAAMSASVLRQMTLIALTFLLAIRLQGQLGHSLEEIARTVFELLLVLVVFDRLLPQIFFTKTKGEWIATIIPMLQVLFYLVLPVTLAISLLLSIAGLAEPEITEPEHPGEAMDALLEAGEEEGVLDEEDRELVRSVVEFGDKVVREVMTPRPDMFAVARTTTLEQFTAEVTAHNFSRVPVYGESMDDITGIAFARDLLGVQDADAGTRTVAELERPALFIPETKKVNELLREMQRQKQHMSIVIDEYGGVAGLVTIEDLLEAIVGNIEDEHDAEAADEVAIAEPEGTWLVPGSFEVARLRELFEASREEEPCMEKSEEDCDEEAEAKEAEEMDQMVSQLLSEHEATTVGGLVSEIAGHIPLAGEVVEEGPLRLEVVASTDRLVERVRVGLRGSLVASESE
ncbi:CBS domain-containing protein [Granulicella sp. 5B5]|uniref:hemolysin family protein n=1 Tax=Granulicella sp. 5B5 TaxID=1617967 RepID=UPI001752F9B7|nr:hemolysin family protein [Granulicella sp. 5B5]QMV17902.1 CBS domain-containing protein [Granulicella sp. 5B5]